MDNTTKPPTNVTPLRKRRRDTLTQYVETASSARIRLVLDFARTNGDMGVVCGAPGVGKTRTARHFADQHPGDVWIATMTPASSALVPALEAVAEALGVHETLSGARRVARAIRSHVGDGASKLLVVDEAQHLSMVAIEELRQVHDATGCGLVFMGNETVHARFHNKVKRANYAQIASRVGIRAFVPAPTDDDVAALCAAWSVTDEDAVDLLTEHAKRPGALRSVAKLVRVATANGARPSTHILRASLKIVDAEV